MLILKRKLFALNNQYTIYDGANNTLVFTARSRYLSPTKNIRLYDAAGNKILHIKKKLFRIMPEYDIYSENQLVAKIKRKFAYSKYVLLIFNGPSIQIAESIFYSKRFTVYSASRALVIIQKLLALSHTYSIDYSQEQSASVAVAYAIVVDMLFRKSAR